ncbi:MAG: hypothetical protein GC156_01295 [Actinomycetales bacterium]|nr:hypothetical protein [Actinomycetales bacterium]
MIAAGHQDDEAPAERADDVQADRVEEMRVVDHQDARPHGRLDGLRGRLDVRRGGYAGEHVDQRAQRPPPPGLRSGDSEPRARPALQQRAEEGGLAHAALTENEDRPVPLERGLGDGQFVRTTHQRGVGVGVGGFGAQVGGDGRRCRRDLEVAASIRDPAVGRADRDVLAFCRSLQ